MYLFFFLRGSYSSNFSMTGFLTKHISANSVIRCFTCFQPFTFTSVCPFLSLVVVLTLCFFNVEIKTEDQEPLFMEIAKNGVTLTLRRFNSQLRLKQPSPSINPARYFNIRYRGEDYQDIRFSYILLNLRLLGISGTAYCCLGLLCSYPLGMPLTSACRTATFPPYEPSALDLAALPLFLVGSIYIYGNVGCGFYIHIYRVFFLGGGNGGSCLLRRRMLSREMSCDRLFGFSVFAYYEYAESAYDAEVFEEWAWVAFSVCVCAFFV